MSIFFLCQYFCILFFLLSNVSKSYHVMFILLSFWYVTNMLFSFTFLSPHSFLFCLSHLFLFSVFFFPLSFSFVFFLISSFFSLFFSPLPLSCLQNLVAAYKRRLQDCEHSVGLLMVAHGQWAVIPCCQLDTQEISIFLVNNSSSQSSLSLNCIRCQPSYFYTPMNKNA